jgi:hypothetical protein
MTRYEKLLIKAKKEGVEVLEIDLGTNKKCGKYISKGKESIIIINSRISCKEKHEVLAEELGHHIKNYGNITDQSKIENRKQELIARRHGYQFILNPLDIVHAMKCGFSNIYDLADFYELTVEEIVTIMEDFKTQYGIGKRFNEYFITFEPAFAFVKMFDGEIVS